MNRIRSERIAEAWNDVSAIFRIGNVLKGMTMEEKGIRINKFLSEAGVCSRRAADCEVEIGNVVINGKVASLGDRIYPEDKVFFKGKEVKKEEEHILLVYNKPRGIVCTAEKREKDNIIDAINYPKRIYPVGRLDKDSEGLILLTNDGEIVNKIMRAGNFHEKEYIVKVNKKIQEDFVEKMSAGIYLEELDRHTRPCVVKKLDANTFSIILTQGLNRQIRRMCASLGYEVRSLKRIRIMNILLGELKVGTYRSITQDEWKRLNELIKDSTNLATGHFE